MSSKAPQPQQTRKFCHQFSQWLFNNAPGDVLMASISGSYLYGTAHSDSDVDAYVVAIGGKNTQRMIDMGNGLVVDVKYSSLDRFVELVTEGSHQAVEALFSPYAVWDTTSPYYPFLVSHRVSLGAFGRKCSSAATSLRRRGGNGDGNKFFAHADRLEEYVLHALDNCGEFSPVWREF